MCTLTWRRDQAGVLEVHFNRDELKTRPVADPPAIYSGDGVRFLSPRDPRGGGTWMLANERGMLACLLNRWELEIRTREKRESRGRLVWSLAGLGSAIEVGEQLSDLERYQAFSLVVFSQEADRCFEWDGRNLRVGGVPDFLTSSSFRFEEVREARRQKFLQQGGGEEFHRSTDGEASAYTVRMNRPDAQTWSRSRICVGDRIAWSYLAEPANLEGEGVATRVELALK